MPPGSPRSSSKLADVRAPSPCSATRPKRFPYLSAPPTSTLTVRLSRSASVSALASAATCLRLLPRSSGGPARGASGRGGRLPPGPARGPGAPGALGRAAGASGAAAGAGAVAGAGSPGHRTSEADAQHDEGARGMRRQACGRGARAATGRGRTSTQQGAIGDLQRGALGRAGNQTRLLKAPASHRASPARQPQRGARRRRAQRSTCPSPALRDVPDDLSNARLRCSRSSRNRPAPADSAAAPSAATTSYLSDCRTVQPARENWSRELTRAQPAAATCHSGSHRQSSSAPSHTVPKERAIYTR